MIFLLTQKHNREVKNKIDADNKIAAINYFSALLHLKPDILLNIYRIRRFRNRKFKKVS